LFTATAASFPGFYQKWHFREVIPALDLLAPSASSLDHMLDGTAPRPFVYRQLFPAIASGIDSITPIAAKERLFSFRTKGGSLVRERFFVSPLARSHEYFFDYLVVYVFTFAFAFLASGSMFMLVRSQGFNPLLATAAASVMILLMPVFMSVGGYYYDYAELAFLVIAVFIALNLPWIWMIPLAVLATWNKESFLLFVPCLYPLLRSKCSKEASLAATGATGLAASAVVFALRSRFAHNPGGSVEFHLHDQISYLLHPMKMLAPVDSTYGIICIPSLNPITVLVLVFLACEGWSGLSLAMRRFTFLAALINVPLFVLFCAPGELRNLSFLYVSLLLLIAVQMKKAEGSSEGGS